MFSILQNGTEIYRPLKINSSINSDGKVTVDIFNISSTIIKNAGIYISVPKNLGEVLRPADMGPYIDYNNLLEWGTTTIANGSYGGLKMDYNGTVTYFTYSTGNNVKNKISIGDIVPGGYSRITITLEVPSNVSSRRLYISVNAE